MAERTAELEPHEEQFLAILNNREKYAVTGNKKEAPAKRDGGFVVVAPQPVSLRPLQDLCLGQAQTYNTCVTLRLRLDGPSTFGTLIWAIRSFLLRFGEEGFDPPADYRSAETATESLIPELGEQARSLFDSDTPVTVPDFLRLLNTDALLGEASKGMRLVLFCERTERAEDDDEWISVLNQLLFGLPERVGLVLSGAPDLSAVMQTKSIISEATNFLQLDLPDSEADGDVRYRPSGLSSDQAAKHDLLNVAGYALGLAEFVLHPDTRPLTIGVHGKWGAGKSSFMGFIDSCLIENAPANRGKTRDNWSALESETAALRAELEATEAKLQNGTVDEPDALKRRAEETKGRIHTMDARIERLWTKMKRNALADVITVWFNAWRFQDAKQIWAGLASEIIGRLESSMTTGGRMRLRLAYVWKASRAQVTASALAALVAIAAACGLVLWPGAYDAIVDALTADVGKEPLWQALAGTVVAAPVLAAVYLVWRIFSLALPVSTRVLQYSQLPSYRDQMGFQHKVLDDVRFVSARLARSGRSPKVVIFIDDLDRCSEDKILEVLQAVNLILGASNFFVFLGVDTEMIHAAIESHYDRQKMLRERRRDLARLYLRKIIQLSFHIPIAGEVAHKNLISSFFTPAVRAEANGGSQGASTDIATVPVQVPAVPDDNASGLKVDTSELIAPDTRKFEEVIDTPEELKTFFEYRPFIDTNARETKRLLNVHRLVKILLQPAQGWLPDQQAKLVKWLIFCTRWPHLIDDVFDVLREYGPSDNAIASMVRHRRLENFESGSLAKFSEMESYVVSSDDLLPEDSVLQAAALIAETIREDPETVTTGDGGATDDPAPAA